MRAKLHGAQRKGKPQRAWTSLMHANHRAMAPMDFGQLAAASYSR